MTPEQQRHHQELVARAKAQIEADWASFRHNFPMLAYELLKDFGGGVVLGIAFGLSLVLYVIRAAA